MSILAVKTLSEVEVNAMSSNQHEFNGVSELQDLFGVGPGKRYFTANFVYMSDAGIESQETGSLTWYDARENHPYRTEYRLYYNSSLPRRMAKAGDTLLIAPGNSGRINVFIIAKGAQLAHFLVSQLGRIGTDCCIVKSKRSISAIENVLPSIT